MPTLKTTGICSHCCTPDLSILANGTVAAHRMPAPDARVWGRSWCYGSNRLPALTSKVAQDVRALASGTIASLCNLTRHNEIDWLREKIAQRAERWVQQGALDATAPWQRAWNMFKASVDVGRKP